MPLRVSIPIFPGVRYTASTRRRRKGEPSGCVVMLGILLLLAAIEFAIKYWYVTVSVLGMFVVLLLLGSLGNHSKTRSGPARPKRTTPRHRR